MATPICLDAAQASDQQRQQQHREAYIEAWRDASAFVDRCNDEAIAAIRAHELQHYMAGFKAAALSHLVLGLLIGFCSCVLLRLVGWM